MESQLTSENFVCELNDIEAQTSTCYFVTKFSSKLTPNSDSSGAMKKEAISENQGTFLEVKLDQLITAVAPDNYLTSQIFD